MRKYSRQHSTTNMGKGFYWIALVIAIGYIIYRIDSCRQAVNEVHDAEMQEKKYEDFIMIDSNTGVRDTLRKEYHPANENK